MKIRLINLLLFISFTFLLNLLLPQAISAGPAIFDTTASSVQYMTSTGGYTRVNGFEFNIRSEYGCNHPNHWGSHTSQFKRTKAGVNTSKYWYKSKANATTVCVGDEHSASHLQVGCQSNPYTVDLRLESGHNIPAGYVLGYLRITRVSDNVHLVNYGPVNTIRPSSGSAGSTSFSVVNDVTYKFNVVFIPRPTAAHHVPSNNASYTTGDSVQMGGRFSFPIKRNGGIRIQYNRDSGSWTNHPDNGKRCGDGGRTMNTNGWRPDVSGGCYQSNDTNTTYDSITNLQAGTYNWFVQPLIYYNGRYVYGPNTENRVFKVTSPPTTDPASCSCNVNPNTGLAPLTVEVSCSGANLSNNIFSYVMGDGTSLPDRGATIYHTYKTGSETFYTITATHPASNEVCTVNNGVINVSNPGSGGGYEVAP